MTGGYPRTMEQLHVALQNSFGGIRKDIEDIRTAHAFLVRANKELADAIERTHKEAVSADQLNLLKIKLSDAVEEAKKAASVEKKLDSAVDRIDKRLRAINEQFALTSDVGKKVSGLTARLDELASRKQQHLLADEFNTFVDELNSELRRLHDHIERLEGHGGRVVDMRIDELRHELDSERSEISEAALRLEGMQEKFVMVSSMEHALDDINAEFDAIKADVGGLRRDISSVVERHSLARKSVLQEKKGSLKQASKMVVDDDLDIEVIKTEGGPMEKREQRPLFWGNVLIALAFSSLFVSVFLTFLRKTPWDGYVLWGGGIGFMVLGTILRIVGIVKSKKE